MGSEGAGDSTVPCKGAGQLDVGGSHRCKLRPPDRLGLVLTGGGVCSGMQTELSALLGVNTRARSQWARGLHRARWRLQGADKRPGLKF